ncbi:MAG: elongation factor G [Aureispira sp.]|nr:elongation factor G [Aureispira sp.]
MRARRLMHLRNIGIAAHIDAGKTTMTERMLFYTGKTHKIGDTHTGNTTMDFKKAEKDRGITISSAATQTQWNWLEQDYTINIIDTPGHVDFTAEVERSLRVLDGLVVLFSAVSGVEPQSETVWRQADKYKVPRIGFVNKMDLAGADFGKVLQQMEDHLGVQTLALQVPIGEEDGFEGVVDLITMQAYTWQNGEQQLMDIPQELMEEVALARRVLLENLAEHDEVVLSKYFEDADSISVEDLYRAIRSAVLERAIVPMLCGSAYRNKGVEQLIDAVAAYLPSPINKGAVTATLINEEQEVERQPTVEEAFTALAFKVALDEQNRKVVYLRVYAGQLDKGEFVLNARTQSRERLGTIFQMNGAKRESLQQIRVGDIVAVIGLKDVRTGDTLSDLEAPVRLESIDFPEPVVGMAIEVKASKDLTKLSMALAKLQEEDPTFQVQIDQDTGQTIIRGMGELHLEVLLDRLQEEFNVECNVGQPEVTYKEALTDIVTYTHRLKKQGGGKGLFAQIAFDLGPVDSEFLDSEEYQKGKTRLQFVNDIFGGSIPREFLPAVQKGFEAMLAEGVLAGYGLDSVKVRVFDGAIHKEDSKPLAFELCAKEGFKLAAPLAKPVLLEPIMAVEIVCPEDHIGTIMAGINRRRGLPKGLEEQAGSTIVKADIPLAELFGYTNHLRAATSGRASATLTFSHYAPTPVDISNQVIAKRQATVAG